MYSTRAQPDEKKNNDSNSADFKLSELQIRYISAVNERFHPDGSAY